MKQCLMIALMTLGMATPALAGGYTCYQKLENEVLKIKEIDIISADLRVVKSKVLVTLETPAQILEFTGQILFDTYVLTDEQDQPVQLAVKTIPVEYGGDCKRCSSGIEFNTFAKLTLANGEVHDFECQ